MRSFSAKGSLGLEWFDRLGRQSPPSLECGVVKSTPWLGRYRPRRGDCVELVRVVQHRRFGGACGPPVVMARDGVQQLCACIRLQSFGALLDRSKSQVDEHSKPTYLCLYIRLTLRALVN